MRKSYLSIVLIVTLALTACGTNASNATNVTSISVEDMPLSAEPADATTTQNNSIQAVFDSMIKKAPSWRALFERRTS